MHATARKNIDGSGGDDGHRSPLSSSLSSSSAEGATGTQRATRLTPDTASEDEYAVDVDEKDSGEGYELEEGIGNKHDEDGRRSSSEERPSRPRQPTQLYTPEEEQAVVRKFDRRLVVFLALLYMLSFLDRSSTPPLSSLPPRVTLMDCRHW